MLHKVLSLTPANCIFSSDSLGRAIQGLISQKSSEKTIVDAVLHPNVSTAQRQQVLSSNEMRALIIRDCVHPARRLAIFASLCVGSFKWEGYPRGGFSRPHLQDFLSSDSAPLLSFDAKLTCMEFILYSAFLAGSLSRDKIRDISNQGAKAYTTMGFSTNLPSFDSTTVKQLAPAELGALVFMNHRVKPGIAHIGIYLRCAEILQIWNGYSCDCAAPESLHTLLQRTQAPFFVSLPKFS